MAAAADLFWDAATSALPSPISREPRASIDPVSIKRLAPRTNCSARLFRDDSHRGRRGCLWVNTIAEFTNRGLQFDVRADGYRHRLWAAFANALSEEAGHAQPHSGLINRRSRMLTATTFGIWLTARFDPNEAARVCDRVAAEVRSWKGTNRPSTSALRESR